MTVDCPSAIGPILAEPVFAELLPNAATPPTPVARPPVKTNTLTTAATKPGLGPDHFL